MKKSKTILKLAFPIIMFIVGFAFARLKAPNFVPPLSVVGDVETVLNVSNLEEIGQIKKIRSESGFCKGASIKELLLKSGPQGMDKIYIVANDGFTAALDADSLEESYIAFSAKNGWELINTKHPISSNVKMIHEIIVVAKDSPSLNSFTIVSKAETLDTTVGSLYTQAFTSYPYFEGQASLEHGGKSYNSEIYTRRRVFKIGDLLPSDEDVQIILFGENGKSLLADVDGYYQLVGNRIDYIHPEEREKLEGVRLAVVDPPARNIADIYYDSGHYLEKGEDVLILLVEGLNYSRCEDAIKKGRALYLSENAKILPALGHYPFDTKIWLNSMFTGSALTESFEENESNGPKPETLFDICKASGKKAVVLGINDDILDDMDENITIKDFADNDNKIYKKLLDRISEGYGLIIAVFNHLEENNRMAADSSYNHADSIERLDEYICGLVSEWQGKIMIMGLPSKDSEDSPTDRLFVPYMILGAK